MKLTLFVECVAPAEQCSGSVTYLAADAERHAIVRQRRILQTLLVANQRIGPAVQINQVMPVQIVARQA